MKEIQTIVAEDHPLMRAMMVQTVNSISGFTVCAEKNSATGLLNTLQCTKADCLVLDLYLGGVCMVGYIPKLFMIAKDIQILVVSACDDVLYVSHALRAGAIGYVSKSAERHEFVEALKQVAKGQLVVPDGMRGQLTEKLLPRKRYCPSDENRLFGLTAQEIEVFRLMGEWKSTEQIADLLKISPATVGVHRFHIKAKMGCPSIHDLMCSATSWVQSNKAFG